MTNNNDFLLSLELKDYFNNYKTSVIKLKDLLAEQTGKPPIQFKDLTQEQQNWFKNYLRTEKNQRNVSYTFVKDYWENPKNYDVVERAWSAMKQANIATKEDDYVPADTTGGIDRSGYKDPGNSYNSNDNNEENPWAGIPALIQYLLYGGVVILALYIAKKFGFLPEKIGEKIMEKLQIAWKSIYGYGFSFTRYILGLFTKGSRIKTLEDLLASVESSQILAKNSFRGSANEIKYLDDAYKYLEKLMSKFIANPLMTKSMTNAAVESVFKLFQAGKISKETLKKFLNEGRGIVHWEALEPQVNKIIEKNPAWHWKNAI